MEFLVYFELQQNQPVFFTIDSPYLDNVKYDYLGHPQTILFCLYLKRKENIHKGSQWEYKDFLTNFSNSTRFQETHLKAYI